MPPPAQRGRTAGHGAASLKRLPSAAPSWDGSAGMTRRVGKKPRGGVENVARWTSVLALAVAVPVVPLGTGCETSCSVEEEEFPEDVHSGITDAEEGTYASDLWSGPYHHFPPKKRYRFYHGLNAVPRNVETWVGFVKRPLGEEGKGNVAEASGNIVIIQDVTPDYIQVRNDTCETFYLRVYASDPEGAVIGAGGAEG